MSRLYLRKYSYFILYTLNLHRKVNLEKIFHYTNEEIYLRVDPGDERIDIRFLKT